ncbi:MAG: DUF1173 family protein [Pseudorhizobium sp.]
MARQLQIGAEIVAEDDDRFVGRLAHAYHLRRRPMCLCRPDGVALYVARIGAQFVAKRMPLTGKDHHPSCQSFTPADDRTGLCTELRAAVIAKDDCEPVAIDVDFTLATGRTSTSTGDDTSVRRRRALRARLSLLALLHLLWHAAGLVEWTGYWNGKRRWWHVHRYLVKATQCVSIRGEPLSERAFIPEPFKVADKLAIAGRRSKSLARIFQRGANQRMLLIGEVKELRTACDRQEITLKHMPGVRLLLDAPQSRRLQRGFRTPLTLWSSDQSLHLIAIATVEAGPAGALRVVDVAVMTVTEHWLPVEDVHELQLVTKLARRRSKLVKTLRFDAPKTHPIATVTLPDARPLPWTLYRVPVDAGTGFEPQLARRILAHPETRAWIWRPRAGAMPPLPFGGVKQALVDGEDD